VGSCKNRALIKDIAEHEYFFIHYARLRLSGHVVYASFGSASEKTQKLSDLGGCPFVGQIEPLTIVGLGREEQGGIST